MRFSKEQTARLWKELKDAQASQATDLAKFFKEIKAKENEALEKEAGTYVQAHDDLLAELVKRYPKEDFTWLEKLALGVDAESDGESGEEGESVNIPDDWAREGSPSVWPL